MKHFISTVLLSLALSACSQTPMTATQNAADVEVNAMPGIVFQTDSGVGISLCDNDSPEKCWKWAFNLSPDLNSDIVTTQPIVFLSSSNLKEQYPARIDPETKLVEYDSVDTGWYVMVRYDDSSRLRLDIILNILDEMKPIDAPYHEMTLFIPVTTSFEYKAPLPLPGERTLKKVVLNGKAYDLIVQNGIKNEIASFQ